LIILFSILTIGLFFNTIKIQESIYSEVPLQKEMKQMIKIITGKEKYGTYTNHKPMEQGDLFFLIKNYIFIKNAIITPNKIIIYSHSYLYKKKMHNDKIVFYLDNYQLKKIIYARVPAIKISMGPGTIKIPPVTVHW